MKNSQPTLEHAFYAVALAIAIGLRFIHLGVQPLSDYEATWALQSLKIVQGLHPAIGPNPAYVHLTAILFAIFGATNFLARLWPALAGTALVLAPWFLRERVGRVIALVLAFGLALDPGLVAISHLAGGPMMAITFLVFTVLAWAKGKRILAGILAGLVLLSGPSLWLGLLGIGLAWAFISGTVRKWQMEQGETVPWLPGFSWQNLRPAVYWGIGTLLVVGSLLIFSPKGLEAFIASFWTFLKGWVVLSNVPAWQPALALPAYEILPLGFGIAGAVRGIRQRDQDVIALGVWALIAILLTILYPSRQMGDLTWAILPLWVLTAYELNHHFDFAGKNLWEIGAVFIVVFAFLVFGWLNVATLTTMDLAATLTRTRMYLLLAVVFLIILSLLLAGPGWSTAVARLGGVWAGVTCLVLFTIAMSTGAAAIREPLTNELWPPQPRAGRLDIMLKVANQISELNRGDPAQLPLTILATDSPALHWLFRDWKVQDVTELAPESTPEMIITPPGNVSLTATYRGEPLVLNETVDWDHATSAQWLKWFVYRQMPVAKQQVDLWVRSDLMLDSQGLPSTTP